MDNLKTEMSMDQMEKVTGGNLNDQFIELRRAVMGNRVLTKLYNEFSAEDDELTDDVLLEMVLAEGCSIRMKILDDQIIYNDGKWSHAEVIDRVIRAYGGSRPRR